MPDSNFDPMKKSLRVLALLGAVLLGAFVVLFFKSRPPLPRPIVLQAARPVAAFTLTERSGRFVTRDSLLGSIWIADFFYTDCPGICRNLGARMAELQKKLSNAPDVKLVSFSVDPERDTPEVLKAYAERYGADPERWLFLTGKKADMQALVVESFMLAFGENPDPKAKPEDRITHSSKLALVDAEGKIHGYYEALSPDSIGQLLDAIDKLRAAKK